MTVLNVFGDAFVSEDELAEKYALGQIQSFVSSIASKPDKAVLEFSTGMATAKNLLARVSKEEGEAVPFTPVGTGKPLTIEFRNIYTGKYPQPSFFDKSKDMLVCSAIKTFTAFEASPRAVNFLKENVEAGSSIKTPAATEKGTPLIYYSPALVDSSNILTLEIVFDEFPKKVFDTFSNIFTAAAGIPIFMSYSVYLLAAGAIAKLVGEAGEKLFDGQPAFTVTDSLNFERPGEKPPHADFRILVQDNVDISFLNNLKLAEGGELVDKDGKRYDGPNPYITISLDGRENKQYENFAPTAASAALLDQFYNIKDGQEKPMQPLIDALKLYNDVKYRKEADELMKEMKGLDNNSDAYKKKKTLYDAAIANIIEDLLKPKS